MPKLPKTVKMGASVYSITNTEEAWKERVGGGHVSHEVWGETDHANTQIHIKPGQSSSQERHTVLHELLHMIYFCAIDPDALAAVSDKEEYTVNILEPWLLVVLRENPDMIEYLLAEPDYAQLNRLDKVMGI